MWEWGRSGIVWECGRSLPSIGQLTSPCQAFKSNKSDNMFLQVELLIIAEGQELESPK